MKMEVTALPVSIWCLVVPAAVLLAGGIYTFRRRRRWPSFSVALILCDAFFLVCMAVLNTQISTLSNATANSGKPPMSVQPLSPVSLTRITELILNSDARMTAEACRAAYLFLQTAVAVCVLLTILSMVYECYRIFSVPPELAEAQKKLTDQEARIREGQRFPLHSRFERRSDGNGRKNKM